MWTQEHEAKARAEGWSLSTTIDNGTTHPYLMIIAVGKPFASNQIASRHVLARAHERSELHITALQAVAASRIKSKGKK